MKNIAIYARYSSEAQRKESIKQQVEACKRYAEQNDMVVISIYKDEAKSGRNDDRNDFQRMIRDSKNKNFEYVLVWKFDRFARNIRDALNYEYELEQNGVKVISATELIPEGSIGIICKAVLLGVNEYYSVDLIEKTQRGMIDNATSCLHNGGIPAFGFKVAEDKRYIIDETNAKWVEKIFSMYANGKTVASICEYLNSMGIKTSKGVDFNKNSLHTMLRNEKYIGTYTYGDISVPNGIPRIISDELFERVQKVLDDNKKMPSRKRAVEDYLLTGKLFCGICKEKEKKDVMLIGHSGNAKLKYCYYKCKNEKSCRKKMVPKEYIEEFVIQKCRAMLTDKNIAKIAKEIYKLSQKDNANIALEQLLNELQNNEKAKASIMKSIEMCDDDIVRQELHTRMKQIILELDRLNTEIDKEKTKTLGVNENDIKFFLKQFKDYDILNIEHRKAIVNMLINKIYLYDDKITFTIQTGSGTTEITDKLYEDIQKSTQDESFCLQQNSGHHVAANYAA